MDGFILEARAECERCHKSALAETMARAMTWARRHECQEDEKAGEPHKHRWGSWAPAGVIPETKETEYVRQCLEGACQEMEETTDVQRYKNDV